MDLVDLAAPSQVKSFQFQVAAEIFDSSRPRILGLNKQTNNVETGSGWTGLYAPKN